MLSSAALGPAQCLDQGCLPMQLTHDAFMCLQLSTICVEASSAPVCIAYLLSGYAGAFGHAQGRVHGPAALCSEQATSCRCPKLVSMVLCQVQLMEPSAAEERTSASRAPAARGLQALAIVDRTFKDLNKACARQPGHLMACGASWLADLLQALPSLR